MATIILLALTVTLFASIFAFVTTFPSPPAQNSNQFQANLVVSSCGASSQGCITGINITHLAGPTVPTVAQIYFKSSGDPSVCPFTNPIPVWNATSGKGISSTYWSLGQTWGVPFSQICTSGGSDPLPDNVTVYVVYNSNLLFSAILPGSTISTPPQILSSWVSPSPVPKGSAFSVDATIVGTFRANSVYVSLANVPGLPASPVKMVPYQGHWVWNSTGNSSGPTKTGTYSGFINVSGSNGASVYGTVSIPVISNAGGIVVSITATPTSGVAPLHVAFAASVSGANGTISYAWSFGDLKGNTSTLATPKDWYNTSGTYLVSLTVTDSKGNQGSATQIITVTLPNHVAVITWASGTSFTNCVARGGTHCPTLYWEAWNNGTFEVTVSGYEYANATGSPNSWAIGSTNINAGANTGQVNPLGGTTTFQPSATGTYGITVVLTVTAYSSGAFVGTLTYTWAQTIAITS